MIFTFVYLISLVVGLIGGIVFIRGLFKADIHRLEKYRSGKNSWFIPELTYGTIAARLLVPFIPVVNIAIAAMYIYVLAEPILDRFDAPVITINHRTRR